MRKFFVNLLLLNIFISWLKLFWRKQINLLWAWRILVIILLPNINLRTWLHWNISHLMFFFLFHKTYWTISYGLIRLWISSLDYFWLSLFNLQTKIILFLSSFRYLFKGCICNRVWSFSMHWTQSNLLFWTTAHVFFEIFWNLELVGVYNCVFLVLWDFW